MNEKSGRTARSLIREARNARSIETMQNMPLVGDDGFRPDAQKKWTNPLAELIDDETYALLERHGVLYEKAIRDHQIRAAYRKIKPGMSSSSAIEKIRESYPYLQFDTIRKIIYARADRTFPS